MAVSNLLALIDDIATVLDDISLMTKVAARKTAGVLGDDLALNAEQVRGVRAEREIPVVWAVFLGSLRNKAILVPAALVISLIAPWAITPLLMLGGLFLCFEGAEKLVHRMLHSADAEQDRAKLKQALQSQDVDFAELERDKIKGAIRTDFILSAEIIVITLGTVAAATLPVKIAVMIGIALLMTAGVYGLVAAIVKLDDLGIWLCERSGDGAGTRFLRGVGRVILRIAPWFMKLLSVAGTIAMFLVGGGILVHGIPGLGHWFHGVADRAQEIPALGDILADVTAISLNGLFGVVVGLVVVGIVELVQHMRAN